MDSISPAATMHANANIGTPFPCANFIKFISISKVTVKVIPGLADSSRFGWPPTESSVQRGRSRRLTPTSDIRVLHVDRCPLEANGTNYRVVEFPSQGFSSLF